MSLKYKRYPTEIVYANDYDEPVCDIFDANFNIKAHRKKIEDIASEDIPDHDILTAGFPCQSFSIVAQNPPRLGIKDPQGNLFFEICRVLKAKKPICFVAENVKGILSVNNKQAFPLIMTEFRKCGYHVVHMLVDAYHFGVPQRRQRVIMVGFRYVEHMDRFCPPCPVEERSSLRSVILPEEEIDSKYYFSQRALDGLIKANKAMNKGRVQNLNKPCNTVGAHLAKVSINSTDPVLCVNGRYRRFNPREVARIQSFPDDFKLVGSDSVKYRALGNAIPPILAWHMAGAVIKALRK